MTVTIAKGSESGGIFIFSISINNIAAVIDPMMTAATERGGSFIYKASAEPINTPLSPYTPSSISILFGPMILLVSVETIFPISAKNSALGDAMPSPIIKIIPVMRLS